MKKPIITNTVKRIAVWYAAILIGFYLLFSVFTLIELNYILVDDLDSRLTHELEHIINTLEVDDDSVKIVHPRELEEPDLLTLTDNPYFLQVYDLSGNVFIRSKNLDYYEKLDAGFPNNFSPYYFEDLLVGNDRLRTVYKQLFNDKNIQIGYIQLSAFQSRFNEVLESIFLLNIFTLPIILALIILASIFLAKKSYDPINKIIELANSISASNLNQRLKYEADPEDELGRLKNTLNSLFERLENQVNEISHFTDNASHQLMTPLTAIKTELEYILKKEHPVEEYKESCEILRGQTDRMIAMVKSMLIMSRECSDCTNSANVLSFSNLMNNEITKIFPDSRVKFSIEKNIYIRGKMEYFSIIVQNLINNAIKYSPKESPVEVSGIKENGNLILSISDLGIGIADEEKDKIFQRFYRIDNDDVNKVSGYGLGLSLVKSVVESMQGTIIVRDNIPSGTTFTIKVPALELS